METPGRAEELFKGGLQTVDTETAKRGVTAHKSAQTSPPAASECAASERSAARAVQDLLLGDTRERHDATAPQPLPEELCFVPPPWAGKEERQTAPTATGRRSWREPGTAQRALPEPRHHRTPSAKAAHGSGGCHAEGPDPAHHLATAAGPRRQQGVQCPSTHLPAPGPGQPALTPTRPDPARPLTAPETIDAGSHPPPAPLPAPAPGALPPPSPPGWHPQWTECCPQGSPVLHPRLLAAAGQEQPLSPPLLGAG